MNDLKIIGFKTLTETIDFLKNFDGRVAFINGGTDLVILMREGKIKPEVIIDISQISEIKEIIKNNDRINIGAGVTLTEIAESSLIRSSLNCLAKAAEQVGSVQIRNRGTIGGNIASASPAGDTLLALNALEAEVKILGIDGERIVPFKEIIIGKGQTSLSEKELITYISTPALSTEEYISSFQKIGSRRSVSISRVNIAAVIRKNKEENIIRESRIVVGALSNKPIRLNDVEKYLKGKEVNRNLVNHFVKMLYDVINSAIPGRYSQNYKRSAIQGVGYDLFYDMFGKVT
ncbi:MAG: FAD binding domain-containing protein [Candidatus Asgardarchaeum sp.]